MLTTVMVINDNDSKYSSVIPIRLNLHMSCTLLIIFLVTNTYIIVIILRAPGVNYDTSEILVC